jgi:hypothetical protein
MSCSALAPDVDSPISESAERTQLALCINHYSEILIQSGAAIRSVVDPELYILDSASEKVRIRTYLAVFQINFFLQNPTFLMFE